MASSKELRGGAKWALNFNAWLVYFFFYAPITLLVVFSFSDDNLVGRWGGFTTRWYGEFLDNDGVQNALNNSIRVAILSTVISVVLGTMAGLALERYRFKGSQVFDALLYLPVIVPDVTMAVMMLIFFTSLDDLIGLQITRGFSTITLAHIAFSISFVSIVVRARLAGMSEVLEEAAQDLYASKWQTFRYITLPQILPGIIGGGLLALTLSLDDVVITQFVSGPGSTTLPVFVFSLIRRGVSPLINAVSVVMLTASILLVLLSLLAQRARDGSVT